MVGHLMLLLGRPAGLRMAALLPGLALTAAGIALMVLWDGRWPHASELAAALLFVMGILASIKAHR
jgi:hypothetical protein